MPIELEYGEVSAVDYPGCRVRVRLDDRDGMQSYWLNVPQRNAQGTKRRPLLPELGEQGAVLLDADGVGGVWLGGIYSTAEPPPVTDEDTDYVRFRDGTTATYNVATGLLAVVCVGTINIEAAQPVTVKAPAVTLDTPQTTLTGSLQVDGNIHANGSIIDDGGNTPNHSH